MKKIKVEDIRVTDLTPKPTGWLSKYAHLLPKTIHPKQFEFIIHPVSNAVSNALRRTICDELLVSAMSVGMTDITTDDPFIKHEMMVRRLRYIPVKQSTPLDTTFELYAVNNTSDVRSVRSGEIVIKSTGPSRRSGRRHGDGAEAAPELPFNDNFELCKLQPGKSITIKNIRMEQAYGYQSDRGSHVVAVNVVSLAVDHTPLNLYEKDAAGRPIGTSISVSDIRKWQIKFISIGTMEPLDIVAAACDTIITRLKTVEELIPTTQGKSGEYNLYIAGESHTIGNLIMREVCDQYPDIGAITYSVDDMNRSLTIRIRCDDDAKFILEDVVKKLIARFEEIKTYFVR